MIRDGKDTPIKRLWTAYQQRDHPACPRWMEQVLWVAGFYNIAWGAFVVLFPLAPFRWASMPAPNYPQIWQCVGMIVGVYGVGYIIAAHQPFRHWPIVLVGLMGKVLGPLGMIWALYNGTLPRVAALTCVTNDLIWWLPFGFILYSACWPPLTKFLQWAPTDDRASETAEKSAL